MNSNQGICNHIKTVVWPRSGRARRCCFRCGTAVELSIDEEQREIDAINSAVPQNNERT